MAKKKKETITINGKEYLIENLLNEQKMLINHINDIDNKKMKLTFNLQQLEGGREYFYNKLIKSVEN